jgi:signal transduction histidine kinase
VTNLVLAAFLFLKNPRSVLNKTAALFSLTIAIYCFSFVTTITSSSRDWALFWNKFLYIGVIFMPVFFTHFTFAVLDLLKKRKVILLGYTAAVLFIPFVFTDLLVKDVVPKVSFKYYMVPGYLYLPLVTFWFSYIIYAHYELVKRFMQSSGLKRNQIRYLLGASVIGFIGGSTSFLPVFDIEVFPFGNYFIALYAFIITYAIVQHRLMDITFVLKKGVTYAYASFLLLIPLCLFVIYGQQLAFKSINYTFSVFILSIIIVAAYFFPKVKVRAEKTVEQFIFKNKYDYRKTISDLSKAMVAILNTNDLCKKIITTTTDAMRVEKASIYILDEAEGFYKLCDSMNFPQEKIVSNYHKEDPFFKWAERHKVIFIREELERYTNDAEALAMAEKMKQMESEICIPLITKEKLIGVISLGMKGKGEMYTHEDLELLTTLSNQATIAIENAKLYEDLSNTKVRMQRADRLAALGTLTAGLAHEIRNPLVAIKTFTQLLPDRFDDDEFRNHFLSVTAGEVDRISSLVTELLEFSRPSQPNLNKEDLNQIVEKMLLLVATESHKKNLQIVKNFHDYLPPVVLDKDQLKQVFLNILLNAVDATPENGIVTVGTKLIKRNGHQDHVQIIIKDTGKGIPQEDLDRIFTPFFTTKHQGSGLGLAISHQIIQEHNGTIEVESEENRGTSFFVTLPLNPLQIQKRKAMEALS